MMGRGRLLASSASGGQPKAKLPPASHLLPHNAATPWCLLATVLLRLQLHLEITPRLEEGGGGGGRRGQLGEGTRKGGGCWGGACDKGKGRCTAREWRGIPWHVKRLCTLNSHRQLYTRTPIRTGCITYCLYSSTLCLASHTCLYVLPVLPPPSTCTQCTACTAPSHSPASFGPAALLLAARIGRPGTSERRQGGGVNKCGR